jgi:hypothetical protein
VEYITQIGYFSTAAGPQVPTVVHDILTVARRVNRSMGVTGLLVAGSNRYLQVIEGPILPYGRSTTRSWQMIGISV